MVHTQQPHYTFLHFMAPKNAGKGSNSIMAFFVFSKAKIIKIVVTGLVLSPDGIQLSESWEDMAAKRRELVQLFHSLIKHKTSQLQRDALSDDFSFTLTKIRKGHRTGSSVTVCPELRIHDRMRNCYFAFCIFFNKKRWTVKTCGPIFNNIF
jgi:hypothetical protein